MDRNIFRFVLRHSRRQQIYITLVTLASFPFLYYSLELPKQIVNEAIGGTDFPKGFLGLELDQIPYLLALSGLFLLLVFVNGGFKYYINTYKGQLGERMLRRLRYELYARVLRFPLPRFKKTSQGEIIPMITGEVEPMGGFIGDAFAQPIFQGGTLLVYLFFIFVQDPVLGLAAVSLYPFQGWLIPRLQRKVNQLGKERVHAMRRLSDRIGETIAGVGEIHAHGAANYHLADVADRLGGIFDIRYEIYRRKFFIKFLNNFINQLTPFFFYAIGGYLVIVGRLDLGALVAVLAAYKDLAAPWKELLTYYQQTEDVRIKYEQVVEQFRPPGMWEMDQLTEGRELDGGLPPSLTLSHVCFAEDDGPPVLDGVNLAIDTRRRTAVLGGSGRDELMLLLARLLVPTSGRIRLGDHDYATLPEAVTGSHITYVGPTSFMFTDTLAANLYYGLKHRPVREASYEEGKAGAWRRRRIAEALATGNTDFDIRADWIDYQAAGAAGPDDLAEKAIEALRAVDMEQDVYRMGLTGTIDPGRHADLAARILEARIAVRGRLGEDCEAARLVELFEADSYNTSATVAENLLFGTPVGPTFAHDRLAEHPYVLRILAETGLTDDFLRMGTKVAETMIELFADLPPGHEFFEQFSFISSEDLPTFQPLVARVSKDGIESLKAEDRTRLMSLPFKLVAQRHRLDLLPDAMQARLLEARHRFARNLPADLRGAVEFFDRDRYNAAASIQDNILFGKIRYGQAGTADHVQKLIEEVIRHHHLRQPVVVVGLDHSVGVGGARLSGVQRQKLALARAILKRPDLLILNGATSALDGQSQARVHRNLMEFRNGRGLIWAPHRPSLAADCDDVIVLKDGRVVEHGSFAALDKPGTCLRELIAAE
ncbi:MAG TPA: ABC transporter ATP-binding protein [Alphaproteobacteria bacterium]|nr:ABC transporter ATP-binding protein [Alphaproteobacteria bacterium]